MATTITIEQWSAHLARMVRTGAIRKGLETAGVGLAMDGWRRSAMKYATGGGSSTTILNVRSGALRQSIGAIALSTKEGVDVVLSSGRGPGSGMRGQKGFPSFGAVPYARVHEEGMTISAKRAPYLHFKGQKGWARVKSVTIRPRPFLQPALNDIAAKADRVISDEIARTLERGL